MEKIQQIKDNRLSARTKRAYESATGELAKFLRTNHPGMFSDNKIDLNKLTIEAFLLFVMCKHDEGRAFTTLSVRLLNLLLVPIPDCIFHPACRAIDRLCGTCLRRAVFLCLRNGRRR
jgi:hypothetical protein